MTDVVKWEILGRRPTCVAYSWLLLSLKLKWRPDVTHVVVITH